MKSYSSDSVTPEQVEEVASRAALEAANALDEKQSRQIHQLRMWCGMLTAVVAAQVLAFIWLL